MLNYKLHFHKLSEQSKYMLIIKQSILYLFWSIIYLGNIELDILYLRILCKKEV